jgi:hypothetical protein
MLGALMDAGDFLSLWYCRAYISSTVGFLADFGELKRLCVGFILEWKKSISEKGEHMYTHVVIGAPDMDTRQILEAEPWNSFHFAGETRTSEAATFVFQSEAPIKIPVQIGGEGPVGRQGMTIGLGLLASVPQAWYLYGNCDGQAHDPQSFHLCQ